eukprot:TRINITY_DN9073_c0_g1_i1.p1 TRINITY_DN9073_c0_g1~~TRINITY_DN9073_c0_g1_i1.p1  ORF type:complete len:701 (+),score=13.51 TRINITY_DN9073_c0_g1_i1:54-2156(+)
MRLREKGPVPIELSHPLREVEGEDVTATLYFVVGLISTAMVGYASVRLRFFSPNAGHTHAMSILMEKVLLPSVLLKVCACFRFDHLSVSVIVACAFSKLIVLVFVWSVTYLFYHTDRPVGKRIISATVFSSCITLTCDFAVGMPSLQALHGSLQFITIDTDVGLTGYLVCLALIQILGFNTLAHGLIYYGISLNRTTVDEDSDNAAEKRQMLIDQLKHELLSPAVISFVVGLLWRHFFGWTLRVDGSRMLSLPSPFNEFVDMFASAYVLTSVFLLGSCIDSATVTSWGAFIVFTRLGLCPAVSRYTHTFFGRILNEERACLLFTFFYSALPTHFEPYHLARKYDPRSTGVVSSSIMFSMLAFFPFLWAHLNVHVSGPLFEKKIDLGLYAAIDMCGMVCLSAIIVAVVLLVRGHWGSSCRAKQLLACYIIELCVYLGSSLALNTALNESPCNLDRQGGFFYSPVLCLYAVTQNTSYFMALALQSFVVFFPSTSHSFSYQGYSVACACILLGCITGLGLGAPNGHYTLCWQDTLPTTSINPYLCLMSVRFLISIILAIMMLTSRPADAEERSALGNRRVCFDNSVDDTHDDIVARSRWTSMIPRSVIVPVALLHLCSATTQFFRSVGAFYEQAWDAKGTAFTVRVLDVILDHGVGVALPAAMMMDDGFVAAIRAGFQEVFGRHEGQGCLKERESKNRDQTDS